MKQKLLSFIFVFVCLVGQTFAQNRQVTGKVTSADGDALAGVSVSVVGNRVATQTDNSGNYSISVAADGKLVFTHVGYSTAEVAVSNRSVINFTMQSSGDLEEVVVTGMGYGSGRSIGNLIASKVTVDQAVISKKPSANVLESLQGRVPGLTVLTSSGEPSATQSIRLHGVGSLGASSSPLFVVDGVPIDAGNIVSTNPEDWESVTVLKDATATSIYGSRAANGVILFKSKQGKIGESATITARAMKGFNDLASRKMLDDMMNAQELKDFMLDYGIRTQEQIDAINKNFGDTDTKWGDYFYKDNAKMDQYDLSFSGGSPKTTYFVSGSFFDQEGVMYRSGFKKVTFRSNINTKLNDWARIGINLSGGTDKRQTNPNVNGADLQGGLSMLHLPWYSPYDENGVEYWDKQIPGVGIYTPKYLMHAAPAHGRQRSFTPVMFVEITPYKGLSFKSNGGMDHYNYRTSSHRLPSYPGQKGNGTVSEGWEETTQMTLTNTIDYRTMFNEVHDFSVLLGQESTKFDSKTFSASGSGLTDDRLMLLGQTRPSDRGVASGRNEYAFNSLFGSLGYAYGGKYHFDFTLRNDQSSRFGKNNRSATFWSAGVMWNAKRESFLADVDWLDELKVKFSTGTQGNAAIGNYEALSLTGSGRYMDLPAWGINTPGNPNLAWESQHKTTFGVTAALFNRVNLTAEVYSRVTTDMLMSVPYPYTSGFSSIRSNVGKMTNKGLDIELSVNVLRSPDYYFTPYVNLNYNGEKVNELFQGRDYWIIPNTGVSWAVGKPQEFMYALQAGVNSETGLMEWYLPGDNITEPTRDPNRVTSVFNEAELQQSTGKRRYPPFIGGFGFITGYKGFSLDADFAFVSGKYMINNDAYFLNNASANTGFNKSKGVRDYWKKPGDVTKYPKAGRSIQFDDGLIENASFLRLKTLRVGYELPKNVLNRQKFFKSARVFYIGRNLFTSTKYSGADPETDSNLAMGRNPNTKNSSFGLELQF